MSNTNETSTNDTNDIEITMTNPMTTSSPTSSINASRENTFSSENEKSLRIALQESSDLTLRVRPTADLYLKTVQVIIAIEKQNESTAVNQDRLKTKHENHKSRNCVL